MDTASKPLKTESEVVQWLLEYARLHPRLSPWGALKRDALAALVATIEYVAVMTGLLAVLVFVAWLGTPFTLRSLGFTALVALYAYFVGRGHGRARKP